MESRNILSTLSANPAESGTLKPDLNVAVSNMTIAKSFAVWSSGFVCKLHQVSQILCGKQKFGIQKMTFKLELVFIKHYAPKSLPLTRGEMITQNYSASLFSVTIRFTILFLRISLRFGSF